jgi:hypothetical protein
MTAQSATAMKPPKGSVPVKMSSGDLLQQFDSTYRVFPEGLPIDAKQNDAELERLFWLASAFQHMTCSLESYSNSLKALFAGQE